MNNELITLIDKSNISIKKLNGQSYCAQAILDIGNLGIQVRGFLIGKDKKDQTKLWCSAPYAAKRIEGSSKPQYVFFIEDEYVWSYLQNRIIEAYREQ